MKLYTDRKYLPTEFPKTPLLYPFWGEDKQKGDFLIEGNRFDKYIAIANQLFEFVPLEEADIALLPFNWEQLVDYKKNHPDKTPDEVNARIASILKMVNELSQRTRKRGKQLIVFFVYDDETIEVPIENAIVFRPSLDSKSRRPNEFPLPGWQADYIDTYFNGKLVIRDKAEKPTVGYCGYDNLNKKTKRDQLRHVLGKHPRISQLAEALGITLIRHPGSRIRSQSLHVLSSSKLIIPNFIIRDAFWNGAITRHEIRLDLATKARHEYVHNVISSDYVLAARGTGNYSFRFYEALCCGRIPVFINTDCVLPYEHYIDWEKYCVWVDETEIPQIDKKVLSFHEKLTASTFRELQYEIRSLWLNWLSPEGFYAQLSKRIGDYLIGTP